MKKYLYDSKVDYLDSRFRNINADVIINSTSEELVRNNTYYFLNQIVDLDICAVVIDQKGEQIGIKNYYSGIKTKTRDELDKLPMSVPTLTFETYQAILSHDEMPSGKMAKVKCRWLFIESLAHFQILQGSFRLVHILNRYNRC